MRIIKLIVVDGDDLSRKGIQTVVAQSRDIELVGAYADLTEADAVLRQQTADVLLLSDDLPRSSDIGQIVRRLTHNYPGIAIIVVSNKLNYTYTRRIFEKGARAFVHRDDRLHEKLVDVIRAVRKGVVYISPNVSALLVSKSASINGIRQRDIDILRFLIEGYTVNEVAAQIGLSKKTIYRRMSHLRELLDVRTNEQLFASLRELGVLDDKKSQT